MDPLFWRFRTSAGPGLCTIDLIKIVYSLIIIILFRASHTVGSTYDNTSASENRSVYFSDRPQQHAPNANERRQLFASASVMWRALNPQHELRKQRTVKLLTFVMRGENPLNTHTRHRVQQEQYQY